METILNFFMVSGLVLLLMSPFLYFFVMMVVKLYKDECLWFQLEDEEDNESEGTTSSLHN